MDRQGGARYGTERPGMVRQGMVNPKKLGFLFFLFVHN